MTWSTVNYNGGSHRVSGPHWWAQPATLAPRGAYVAATRAAACRVAWHGAAWGTTARTCARTAWCGGRVGVDGAAWHGKTRGGGERTCGRVAHRCGLHGASKHARDSSAKVQRGAGPASASGTAIATARPKARLWQRRGCGRKREGWEKRHTARARWRRRWTGGFRQRWRFGRPPPLPSPPLDFLLLLPRLLFPSPSFLYSPRPSPRLLSRWTAVVGRSPKEMARGGCRGSIFIAAC